MATLTKTTPRDVFLYLLVTAALYAIAVSAISLLFQYVNALFPDPLDWYGQATETLRRVLSVLIIVTPVYVWTMRFLNRDLLAQPEKHHLGIRRWLVHLTLFISGVTIIVDLVTLVYNFLGGDLTSRFALKILAVLLVASVVFAYYIWDIRREASALPNKMIWLARVALVVLAVAVVGGFFLMESPAQQRSRKIDDQRVNDLWSVQSAVEAYWWEHEALPDSLEDVDAVLSLPTDPVTGESYAYSAISTDGYELCATFDLESTDRNAFVHSAPFREGVIERDYYGHRAGVDCFARSVKGLLSDAKPLR